MTKGGPRGGKNVEVLIRERLGLLDGRCPFCGVCHQGKCLLLREYDPETGNMA